MARPIKASNVAAEPVQWLWRERIPRGMITIVGGRPDQGKGLFCAHLAAEVTRMKFGDRRGRVLYSAIEDHHGLMTRPRLEASGAHLKNIDLWRFQLPLQMKELEAILLEEPVDLLVIDPFAAHLSGGVSRHSDNVRTVLNPLTDLIEHTRTAVVVTEHVLKRTPKTGHPLQAIGGSGSGLPAASRMAFLFGMDPSDSDRRILACVKSNIREAPKAISFEVDTIELDLVGDVPALLPEAEIDFDAMRMLQDQPPGKVGRPPDKRAAAAEWLTNYLYAAYQGGETEVAAGTVFEDAKHHAMTSKTLRRAATDLEIVRNPPGGGRNCTWALPDEIIDVLNAVNQPKDSVNVETPSPEDGLLTDDDLEKLLGSPPEDGDGDGS